MAGSRSLSSSRLVTPFDVPRPNPQRRCSNSLCTLSEPVSMVRPVFSMPSLTARSCLPAASWIEGWVPTDAECWRLGPAGAGVCRAVIEVLSRLRRIASLVGGYGLSHDRADELADMVVEVIDGIKRSVVRKIAARIPAFVQMEREGILETLSSLKARSLRGSRRSCRWNAKASSKRFPASTKPPNSSTHLSPRPSQPAPSPFKAKGGEWCDHAGRYGRIKRYDSPL